MALREHRVIAEKSLGWLYFDIGYLVAFGGLAVNLTSAPSLHELMLRCVYFVVGGLSWAIIACLLRPADAPLPNGGSLSISGNSRPRGL